MKRSRFLITLGMIPVTAKIALARIIYPGPDRSIKGSSGIPEPGKAGEPDLIEVWNREQDPATDPLALSRSVPPITWEDLDHKFHTTGLRWFQTEVTFEQQRKRDRSNKVLNYKEDLDLYTRIYELGDIMWIHAPLGLMSDNSKDVIDEIARRDLILFDIWDVAPGEYGHTLPRAAEMHQYMMEKLGRRFFGWDNGERDGHWVRASAWLKCPAPVTRKEAFENWISFFGRTNDDLFNYMTCLAMLPMMHYFSDLDDIRIIGPESIQMDPSLPLWFGNIRGAGKQYGLLWFGNISSFTRFGWGNEHGPSISLRKRLWYLETMYGCCFMGYEMGHLHETQTREVVFEGKKMEVPELDLNGRLQMEGIEWCRRHPDRGVMHTPVALMWDFHAGWLPPRVDQNGHYAVWGNIPYEKGDHQIDMVYRKLYPGYEDATYYHDERGYLTPTPHGDIFDVLLSNVSRRVLNRYNAALIMGETRIEGQLLETIEDFLNRGGSVATTASQLTPESALLLGVDLKGGSQTGQSARFIEDDTVLQESNPFTYYHLAPHEGTEVLVMSSNGSPLVLRRNTDAGGSILLFAADYGLSDWIESFRMPEEQLQEIVLLNAVNDNPGYKAILNAPLPSPYVIPEHIRRLLFPWLEQWNLLDVEGPQVQYLVNLTEESDRFIVTLSNNSKSPWEGEVVFRNAAITSGENWMNDEKIGPGKSVAVKLPPEEVVVLELKTDRPLVRFKTDTGPEPSEKELQRESAILRKKVKAITPEALLAAPKPEIPGPAQKPEKPGSLYVNRWLFDDVEPSEWIPSIAGMGLDGVEIRATDLYDPKFPEMRNRILDAGLHIGTVNAAVDVTPFIFGHIGDRYPRRNEPTLIWLEQVLEIMAESGIKRIIVRGDCPWPPPENDDMLIESLQRLTGKSEELGISILLENVGHWGIKFKMAASTSTELVDVIERSNTSSLRASFDTAHAVVVGEDPLQAFQRVSRSGLLEYVHLSNSLSPEICMPMVLDQHVPLEQGDISLDVYKKILQQISEQNLSSSIHMVTHENPIQTLQKTMEIIREL